MEGKLGAQWNAKIATKTQMQSGQVPSDLFEHSILSVSADGNWRVEDVGVGT